MANYRPYVAWSNSTPSLPISYTFSSVHSSTCKGTPTLGGPPQDGGLVLRRGLVHKRSQFQPTGPSSSHLLHNEPETHPRDWDSMPNPPPTFRVVRRPREPHLRSVQGRRIVPHEPAFEGSQELVSAAFLDHQYSHEVQHRPNLVRASSFVRQHGGPRKLLPPIDLMDSSTSSGLALSAENCADCACFECYPPCGDMQEYAFSPVEASCEGPGIFSGYSENGVSSIHESRLSKPSKNLAKSGDYAGQAPDPAAEELRIISPRRRLSYGENLQKTRSKSLHRTAGSRELRHALGWANKANEDPSSVGQVSTAGGGRDGPQMPQHTDEYFALPPKRPMLRIDTFQTSARQRNLIRQPKRMEKLSSRPRLWIAPDLDEQVGNAFCNEPAQVDEYIQNAQYTTISSPKARIITISRRSPQSPAKAATPDNYLKIESAFSPYTPPETPYPAEKRQQDPGSVHDQHLLPITPPSSRITTPRSKDTVRRIVRAPDNILSLTNVSSLGPSFSVPTLQHALSASFPSEPVRKTPNWVLLDLEASIACFPTSSLHLTTPCIQYIRDFIPSNQADVSRQDSWLKAPHSRFSTFNPLGSHPSDSPDSSPPRLQTATSSASSYSQKSSEYPAILPALRNIFPRTPASRLDSLQATYIALHHVSTLRLPSPVIDTSPLATAYTIPPKAAATLGIAAGKPLPRSASLPPLGSTTTLLLPQTLEWDQERAKNLAVDLKILVRGLIAEFEGRRLGKRDESLVRAVGEVVRMGEGMGGHGSKDRLYSMESKIDVEETTVVAGGVGELGSKVSLGGGPVGEVGLGKKRCADEYASMGTEAQTRKLWTQRMGWKDVF